MKLLCRALGDMSFGAFMDSFPLNLWIHLCFNVCSLLIRRKMMHIRRQRGWRKFSIKKKKGGFAVCMISTAPDCWWKSSSWAYGFVWGGGVWACKPSQESRDDVSGCHKASYESVVGMVSISTFGPPEIVVHAWTEEVAGSGCMESWSDGPNPVKQNADRNDWFPAIHPPRQAATDSQTGKTLQEQPCFSLTFPSSADASSAN